MHIGSKDHNLYAINADGTKKWAVATRSVAMYSSPAIASDSTIYVGSWDHNLYAINLDGKEEWALATGGVVDS